MNESDITKIESELKINLPDSYRKVLRDYPFEEDSFGYMCMLSNDIMTIIASNKTPSMHALIHIKNIANHPQKNKNYFWIGSDGGEEEYYLDISHEFGAIYEYDLETGKITEYAQNLNRYIEQIHEIDREIYEDERKEKERRRNAKWWEFWKII
jgi:hypothetical protein